jgi:hypothetical protein
MGERVTVFRRFGLYVLLLLTAGVLACESPVKPAGSVTVTTAGPISPANGAQIANVAQPVTLSINNAMVTDTSAGVTYTFEVASDSGFATKVQTKEVPQAGGTQTTVKLDTLPAGKDYFWHVRTTSGDTVGTFTSPTKFTIGPAVVIQAPVVALPANAATAVRLRPTLTVNNAARTGPAGSLVYRFDVASSNSFGAIIASASVPEGDNGQTSFTLPSELGITTQYFWRVQVTDAANNVTSPFSNTASFTTALTIDLKKVVYLRGPDISNWKETAFLEVVEQDGAGDGPVCMKYADPGWPDVLWPFIQPGDDQNFKIYANQWYFANINGTWYGGAGEWVYRGGGSCKAGQGTRTIGPDSGFGPPFSGWVPKVGEMVGFAITAVARNWPTTQSVLERSNIVVQAWRDTSLGSASTVNGKR